MGGPLLRPSFVFQTGIFEKKFSQWKKFDCENSFKLSKVDEVYVNLRIRKSIFLTKAYEVVSRLFATAIVEKFYILAV